MLEFDITTLTKIKGKIPSMTYNQFAYDLKERDSERKRFVDNVKVIVFDEIDSIIADKHFIKDMENIQEYIEDRVNSETNTTYFIGTRNNKMKYKFKFIIDLLKMLGFEFNYEGK